MQKAWKRRWQGNWLLRGATSPEEALRAWRWMWDSWAWTQHSVMDGTVSAFDDVAKKQWDLHASIIAPKLDRGGRDGAEWGRAVARAVRDAMAATGWCDARAAWTKARRSWKAYQESWPAEGLRAQMAALEARLARDDGLASWRP